MNHSKITQDLAHYIIEALGDRTTGERLVVEAGLRAASLVCKAWRYPAQRQLFKDISVPEPEENGLERFKEFLDSNPHHAKSIKYLRFFGGGFDCEPVDTKEVKVVVALCPNLITLDIPSVSSNELDFTANPRIEVIQLTYDGYVTNVFTFPASLNTLIIKALCEGSVFVKPPQFLGSATITTLVMHSTMDPPLCVAIIAQLGAGLLNLEFELDWDTLSITEADSIFHNTFDNLLRLSISINTSEDPKFYNRILPKFKKLAVLSLPDQMPHGNIQIFKCLPSTLNLIEFQVSRSLVPKSVKLLFKPLLDHKLALSLRSITFICHEPLTEKEEIRISQKFLGPRGIDLVWMPERYPTPILFKIPV